MALTGKKLRFADAVLSGKSNKDAAIEAGYSAATAAQAGSRLVKDPDVVAHIQRRKNAAQKKEPVTAGTTERQAAPSFDLHEALTHSDLKVFLLAAINDIELEPKLRIDAAKALMPFVHQRKGEGGKKEQQNEAAKQVASRFAPAAPPRLAAAGGKKV